MCCLLAVGKIKSKGWPCLGYWVGEGAKPAGFPLPTTHCATLGFSEALLRVSLEYPHLKSLNHTRLTTDGNFEFVHYPALNCTQRGDDQRFSVSHFRLNILDKMDKYKPDSIYTREDFKRVDITVFELDKQCKHRADNNRHAGWTCV